MSKEAVLLDDGFEYMPWQWDVDNDDHIYKIIRIGRRTGKTVYGVRWLILYVLETGNIGLVLAPTYDTLRRNNIPYMVELLEPLLAAGLVTFNRSRLEFDFKGCGGGIIYCISADKPHVIKGIAEKVLSKQIVGRIWLDEFAVCPNQEYLWTDVLGAYEFTHPVEYLVTSTPNGRNFFWELCNRARSKEFYKYKEWHLSSYCNTKVTKEYLEEYIRQRKWTKTGIDENVYANFTDLESDFLGDWTVLAEDYKYELNPIPDRKYAISIDPAKARDKCVIYIGDATRDIIRLVYKESFNKRDYLEILPNLINLSKMYNNAKVVAEDNRNPMFIEALRKGLGGRLKAVHWNKKSKPEMLNNLAYMVDKKLFVFPESDDELKDDFCFYKVKRTEDGRVKAAAQSGHYDDSISSLMMLLYECSNKHNRVPKGGNLTFVSTNQFDPYSKEMKKTILNPRKRRSGIYS